MVGMALALHAPERVERLVLASSAAYLGPPENWHERARLVRAEGLDAIADSVLRRWFTDGFRANRPHATARFRAMLTATSPDGYAACCEAIAGWDARHDVHAIASPTLVLAGAEDPATTSEHAQLLAREIRGARLVTLQGAAHLANVEQPDAFTEALLAHLVAAPGTMEAA
jgi:3-oxoadipate enol-lactonase